jgi:hypothetical protein
MKYLFLILFLNINTVLADTSMAIKYGVGVFNSAKNSAAETKSLFVSLQEKHSFFVHQAELGGWVDIRNDLNRKSSMYGNYSLGLTCNPGYFEIQSLVGIGALSHPDSYLGGRIQFTETTSISVKDDMGSTWGVAYQHISSAGIYQPNIGRDMLMFRVSFPLSK